MLVSVWGLLTAVVLAHMPVGQPSLKQAGGLAARTALLGAPVMALLFLLFPRIGPLWGVPQDGISKTGLSNTMKMGSMTEVARDDSIAMRIRFDGAAPPPARDVLPRPGADAFRRHRVDAARPAVRAVEPAVAAADAGDARHAARLRSDARAAAPRVGAAARGHDRRRGDRRLPPGRRATTCNGSPTSRCSSGCASRRPRARASSSARRAASARSRRASSCRPASIRARSPGRAPFAPIRRGAAHADASSRRPSSSTSARRASATRSLPGTTAATASTSSGSTARRASASTSPTAFVVVMRAAGVPARIVTGYQGTDLPAVDGYYIVRQSSAHAWAEFWQSGTGWVRADPTGAVAPDRIGRSYRLAPQPGFVAGTLDAMNPELFARAAQRLGSRQQPLEPVGPQLLARPAARRPEADGLRRADLGRPRPPPRRHLERAGARRRDLGLARPPSRRPLGAPARADEARAAGRSAWRRRRTIRRARWRRAFASASAPPASRSRRCSMRSRRAATAAPPRAAPTRA